MEGNNYNQRLIVQLPNEICRTLIGQGHSGMEPKVIVCISKKMIIFAESIEEKPIDRYYNKHNKHRRTHYEILGGGIAYCVRKGVCGHVIVYE